MVNHLIENYIDEAISLELNVSNLYFRFFELFPEDARFWWEIMIEEKNHAALLKSLKLAVHVIGNAPEEILALQTDDIREMNESIVQITRSFSKEDSRRDAFEIALKIEQSAGEAHFQTFIQSQNISEEYKIFQKLNLDDKDHLSRLRSYISENKI